MKRLLLLVTACLFLFSHVRAQEADTSYWTTGGVGTLGFSNTGYGNQSYWQGGAVSTITIGGLLETFADFEKGKSEWDNTLSLAFGTTKQGRQDFRKSDDRIQIVSKYGYRFGKNWLATVLMDFRTQFAPGYEFAPDGERLSKISDFFNPAYINIGAGFDFKPSPNFSMYFSPVNGKITIVTVDSLRPNFVPEDYYDKAVRAELGAFVKILFRKEIAKNVVFQTNADFFSNYLVNFGNIDVNWETITSFKVNSWLTATFATHLIYDDDITFDKVDDSGNKVTDINGNNVLTKATQFKHVLSIGLTHRIGAKRAE